MPTASSSLTRAPRLVSVIIPARDAAQTIGDQLAALARQDYAGDCEVIVADNGSRDRTCDVARRWRDRLPRLRVVDASDRPGASFARNVGVAAASGDFLAFCDADDVVEPGWLASLVAAASSSDMVGGPLELDVINDADIWAWMSWQCPRDVLPPAQGFLPAPYGGNCGIWRSALEQVGGWNTDFQAVEDRELGWRVQLAALNLGFAPGAIVHYRFRTDLRALWRKCYREGRGEAQLAREFAAVGLRRTNASRALRSWISFARRVPELGRSSARRGAYVRAVALRAGRLAGSVRYRVLYL